MTKLCGEFFKCANKLKISWENQYTVLKCTQMRARVEKVDVLGWNKSIGKLQSYAEILCDPSCLEFYFFLFLCVPWLLVLILPSWDSHFFSDAFTIFSWHTSLRTHVSSLPFWPISLLDSSLVNLYIAHLEFLFNFIHGLGWVVCHNYNIVYTSVDIFIPIIVIWFP